MKLFYYLYVISSLSPLAIIFIFNKKLEYTLEYKMYLGILMLLSSLLISYFFIRLCERYFSGETMTCKAIEVAEPKYIPIYIAYFVISLSISDIPTFLVVFILIFFLILLGKFSYFNPYLLFMGYNFYEVESSSSDSKDSVKYKIFLISKRKIKTIKTYQKLIRLNDFTFLDTEK